jgi:hypothetical protein
MGMRSNENEIKLKKIELVLLSVLFITFFFNHEK